MVASFRACLRPPARSPRRGLARVPGLSHALQLSAMGPRPQPCPLRRTACLQDSHFGALRPCHVRPTAPRPALRRWWMAISSRAAGIWQLALTSLHDAVPGSLPPALTQTLPSRAAGLLFSSCTLHTASSLPSSLLFTPCLQRCVPIVKTPSSPDLPSFSRYGRLSRPVVLQLSPCSILWHCCHLQAPFAMLCISAVRWPSAISLPVRCTV
jgi:hypothetical protein